MTSSMATDKKSPYGTIRVPVGICERIDLIVEEGMYNSRADFVKETLRNRIRDIDQHK